MDVNNEEKLVVVQEVRTKNRTDWDEIILGIKKSILDNHELQVYSVVLIEPRTIFKTSSGKIQRRATKNAYLNGELLIVKEGRVGSQENLDNTNIKEDCINAKVQRVVEGNNEAIPNEQIKTIEDWIVLRLAETLEIEEKHINVNEPFVNYGLDSAKSVGLVGDLENWLGKTLSPTIIWDYPSIRKLSFYLSNGNTESVEALEQKNHTNFKNESIAIVGLSCRFPGANNLDEFWHLLENGIDGIKEVPADRWDIDSFLDPDPDEKGKMVTRFGGFIDDVDKFDSQFFGISPREATYMDPQQRILLEVKNYLFFLCWL